MSANTTWKEFGKNDLTHSAAHYLMTIEGLLKTQGYARLIDVAKKLNISKGSLSTSLKNLVKKGIIYEDDNKHFFLSEEGKMYATHIRKTRQVFQRLLEALGVDDELAEVDACKIEHLLSAESTTAILRMIKAVEGDKQLLNDIQKTMKEYERCTLERCAVCENDATCLTKKL